MINFVRPILFVLAIVAVAAPASSAGFNPVTVTDPLGVNQAQVDTLGNLNTTIAYPANTAGGGCTGHNATSEANIAKLNYASAALAASTGPTQIIAASIGLMTHICAITITAVLTTAAALTLTQGTGTNCGTGNTLVANFAVGTQMQFYFGDGRDGLLDLISGDALCITTGAWTATVGPYVTLTYATY